MSHARAERSCVFVLYCYVQITPKLSGLEYKYHFLTVSVGQEFGRISAGWVWFRAPRELALGCQQGLWSLLMAQPRLEGLLPR